MSDDTMPKYWNDPTGAAESEIFDKCLGRYRRMTPYEHRQQHVETLGFPTSWAAEMKSER